MKTRLKPTKMFNMTKVTKARWLLLLVFVLLFALVATTAAQEAVGDPDPPVPEPIMISRTVTPERIEEQWIFSSSKDSFLSSKFPNNNYGTWTTLKAGYSAADFQAMRMLIEFNLSPIPSNARVNSATMRIYQTQSVPSNDANMGLQAQYMKSAWSETSVTWNNANYLGGDVIGIGDNTNSLGWKTIDVTSVVREWVSGARTNYGFIVTGMEDPVANRSRTFYSRQKSGFVPEMTVNFDQSCDTVAPTAWVETLPQWSQKSGTVSWTGTDSAPSGCTPVGIATFDVQFNINNGSWTNWKENTTATSANFSEAQNGQTYYLRARAVDKAGNVQQWPSTAQAWTTIDAVAPTAQMNALPPNSFGPNFQISWDGTDNAGGSGIANYDVQFREADGEWHDYITGTTAKSANFGPAENGVTYEFKARATDVAGNVQPWSEFAQTSTTAVNNPIAVVLPFDPVILGPTAPITSTFEVTWKGAPVEIITGYNVQVRFNNGPWERWRTDWQSTESIYEIPSGNPDGTYYFEAAALSLSGSDGLNGSSEAFKIVDLEESFIEVQGYLPIIANSDLD